MLTAITTMLSHGLIFLCIGVYASCMPASGAPIKTALHEIQEHVKHLNRALKGVNVTPLNDSMGQVQTPDRLEEECANFNLATFIKALQSLNVESSENEAKEHLLKNLKTFAEKLAGKLANNLHHQENCTTAHIDPNKLLDELEVFLKEVHNYLGSNKARRW